MNGFKSSSADHDLVELVLGDQPVVVQVGPVDHLLHFLLAHGLAQLLGDLPQVLDRNES